MKRFKKWWKRKVRSIFKYYTAPPKKEIIIPTWIRVGGIVRIK